MQQNNVPGNEGNLNYLFPYSRVIFFEVNFLKLIRKSSGLRFGCSSLVSVLGVWCFSRLVFFLCFGCFWFLVLSVYYLFIYIYSYYLEILILYFFVFILFFILFSSQIFYIFSICCLLQQGETRGVELQRMSFGAAIRHDENLPGPHPFGSQDISRSGFLDCEGFTPNRLNPLDFVTLPKRAVWSIALHRLH